MSYLCGLAYCIIMPLTILTANIWLWSIMYDDGISMVARVLVGSYVRANYPDKVPLLPQYEGSQKRGKAHG